MPIKNPIKKGSDYERLIVHMICECLGLEYDKDLRRRWRGDVGNDLEILSERGKQVFPFSLECKNRKNYSIKEWWTKLLEDTPPELTPILVMHNHRSKKNFVLMDLEDFLTILKNKEVIENERRNKPEGAT